MPKLAATREVELTDEFLGACFVPGGIEGFQVSEKVLYCHPLWHLLVFRHVSNVLEVRGTKVARVGAEHLGTSRGRFEDVHEDLDSGGFSGAVRSDKTEDARLGDIEIQTVEYGHVAKALYEILRTEGTAHSFLLAALSVPSSRPQCCVTASVNWSRSKPSFLASTTSCSSSFLSRLPRSAGVDDGRPATMVPSPGCTSINPSETSCVITLCAVLG